MDLQAYQTIAYSNHTFCSPVNDVKADEIIDIMELEPGMCVLDVGCANGEMLVHIACGCQIKGVGVEPSAGLLRAAYESVAERAPGADITLLQMPEQNYEPDEKDWDAVICIKANRIFDNYENALRQLQQWVRPGGLLMIGQAYRRQSAEKRLSDAPYDYAGTVQAGLKHNLIPMYSVVSDQSDWDRYHWLQFNAIERYAANHSDDAQAKIMLQTSREARDTYLKQIRHITGFGLFLFKKPEK